MDEFFRGYVKTDGKSAIEKFKKGAKLRTLDEVKDLEGYAAILDDNTVVIDIDDYEQSEILMNIVEDKELLCRVYETSRGKHFLFKNPDGKVSKCGHDVSLACGIKADIKVGLHNSYIVRKKAGKLREIIYDIYDDETYQIEDRKSVV